MHWIVAQPKDERTREVLDLLIRTGTPHDVVTGGSNGDSIEPDVSPEGPVICFGSYALRHAARAKGWTPGVIDLDWLGYRKSIEIWGASMLNSDAIFCDGEHVGELASMFGASRIFVRPAFDTKAFDATVVDVDDAGDWANLNGVSGIAQVMLSRPKEIMAEWRTWIVEGKVATASLYRRGGRALFDGRDLPDDMMAFAGENARIMGAKLGDEAPVAYALDIALTARGYRIVEANCIAGARLYDCNVGRLFEALTDLGQRTPSVPTP